MIDKVWAEQADGLRCEVVGVLGACGVQISLNEAMTWSLSQPGRALSTTGSFKWSLIPLLVSDSCGLDWHKATPAAAAIDLWLTAGDVFDEIEDEDDPGLWRIVGLPQAANAATALLFLSQQSAFKLVNLFPAPTVLDVARVISEGGLRSTIGQHDDIMNESAADVTEDDYLKMTGRRSGSLAGAAFKVGALLAGCSEDVVARYEAAGQNTGISAQILNDIRSFRSDSFGKTDIVRNKKTLPLIHAMERAEGVDKVCLTEAMKTSIVSGKMDQRVVEVLDKVGAFDYSLVVANVYAQRAAGELESAGAKPEFAKLVKELLGD